MGSLFTTGAVTLTSGTEVEAGEEITGIVSGSF